MEINGAHWHLLLNHFPIILSITGTGFLLLSFIIKNNGFRNASLFLMIIAALFVLPAYNTGEGAEEVVEELPGTSEIFLEKHEDIAATAMYAVLIAGALALMTMAAMRWNSKWTLLMLVLTSIAALSSAGLLAYTGFTGGKIMHAEIRDAVANTATDMQQNAEGAAASEEDDD